MPIGFESSPKIAGLGRAKEAGAWGGHGAAAVEQKVAQGIKRLGEASGRNDESPPMLISLVSFVLEHAPTPFPA